MKDKHPKEIFWNDERIDAIDKYFDNHPELRFVENRNDYKVHPDNISWVRAVFNFV